MHVLFSKKPLVPTNGSVTPVNCGPDKIYGDLKSSSRERATKFLAVATRTRAVRLGRQSKSTAFILRMRMPFFGYVSCILASFI